MSESVTERIKRWNEKKPNAIMQVFSSDLYEIVQRAEAAEAERAELARQLEHAMQLADVNTIDALCDWIIGAQSELALMGRRIQELEERNDELSGFDMSFAAIALKNKNVDIRHTEYEGENETPFGQALDGSGDEVES
jgi:hypothetical protein